MQIQLDPGIPTNLSPEEMRNFKSFLDTALESLTAAAGAEIFTLGNQMLTALALIVIWCCKWAEDRLSAAACSRGNSCASSLAFGFHG